MITVTCIVCDNCVAGGIPEYVCPDCQEEFESISASEALGYFVCEACGVNDFYPVNTGGCPNNCESTTDSPFYIGDSPYYDLEFPCGHSFEKRYGDDWMSARTCDNCARW